MKTTLASLILIACASVSLTAGKRTSSQRRRPDSAASGPKTTAWSYTPANAPGATCNYTTTLGWSLRCTANEDAGETITVDAAGGKESWKEVCADRCAAIALTPGKTCTGFVFRGPDFKPTQNRFQCIFRQCQGSVVDDDNDVTATVYDPQCLFTASPTSKPSREPTRYPTPQPTAKVTRAPTTSEPVAAPPNKTPVPSPTSQEQEDQPTFRPTPRPTRQPRTGTPTPPTASAAPTAEGEFVSPTNIPKSKPLDQTLFVLDPLDDCYVPRFPPLTSVVTWSKWKGTMLDCMKECQYDKACFGFQYSDKLKRCVKATNLDVFDNSLAAKKYANEEWVTYHKLDSAPSLLYFSNYCVSFVWQKTCNALKPECAWNKGRRGYNQDHVIDRGYCGRTACPVAVDDGGVDG